MAKTDKFFEALKKALELAETEYDILSVRACMATTRPDLCVADDAHPAKCLGDL